jgi:hypothetical protein
MLLELRKDDVKHSFDYIRKLPAVPIDSAPIDPVARLRNERSTGCAPALVLIAPSSVGRALRFC